MFIACLTLLAACSGSDDSTGDAPAVDLNDESTLDVDNTTDTTEVAAEAAPPAASGPCAAVFDGAVSRRVDEGSGHTAADYTGADFAHSKAVSIGDNDYTVYIASAPIEGFTVVADPGEVVITAFVFGGDTALEPGALIPITVGPIIDNSGNAEATTTNGVGEITIVEATGDYLCFDIDYVDEFQQISGTMRIDL